MWRSSFTADHRFFESDIVGNALGVVLSSRLIYQTICRSALTVSRSKSAPVFFHHRSSLRRFRLALMASRDRKRLICVPPITRVTVLNGASSLSVELMACFS